MQIAEHKAAKVASRLAVVSGSLGQALYRVDADSSHPAHFHR